MMSGGEGELVLQLLRPLLPQAGRNNQQDAPAVFGPTLCNDQAGLDRFAEADLVGEYRALRDGRRKREEGGIDLMRVQVHPCRREGFCECVSVAPQG